MLYHLFCVLCCRLSLINFDIEEQAITASGVFCEMKQQKGSDGDENWRTEKFKILWRHGSHMKDAFHLKRSSSHPLDYINEINTQNAS